jgi:hypothetical protein
VVNGKGDEVLQLGRGEGVRDLHEIVGIGSSGRSSLGSGGQRRCSVRIHAREMGLKRRSRRGVETGERAGQRAGRE